LSKKQVKYLNTWWRERGVTESQDDDIIIDPSSQWELPEGPSTNLSISSYHHPHDDSKWESLTLGRYVIRKRKSGDTRFTILYVSDEKLHSKSLTGNYDRIVHILPQQKITSSSRPPIVCQDGVFYYSSPSCLGKPQLPNLQREASTFHAARPIEATHLQMMPIVFHFDVTIADSSGAITATLWGKQAVDFLNGVTPESFLKNASNCGADVIGELRHLLGKSTWSEFVIKKGGRVAKAGNPLTAYEIVNTRLR
uniref:Uncharacterized protein n=1 Tax=Ciona savignyi TaxID=51511 RepID=H2Z6F6_CIOSA